MISRLLCPALLLLCAVVAAAQPKVDSLRQILALGRHDTTEFKVLEALYSEFSRKDLGLATTYSRAEKALALHLNDDVKLAIAYANLSSVHLNASRLDSSLHYVKELEVLSKKSQNKKVVTAYNNIAGLYYRNTGHYREALPFLLEGLKLQGTSGDQTQRAGQMLNIGNTYVSLGELENASSYFLQSLALFEGVGNKRGQSFCLQGLGNIHKDLDRYDVAETYYLRSIKLKEELDDKRGLISSWISLGALYQDMKQYHRSIAISSKGIAAARELDLPGQEMKLLYNLASVMKSMNRNDEARKYFNESLAIADRTGDTLFASDVRANLIVLDTETKKARAKEAALIQHIETSSAQGDQKQLADAHYQLSQWYAQNNDYEKAFAELTRAQAVDDSIKRTDIQLQIKKLEEEYLGEKKDREIALLKKDQELQTVELSRQNTMITASLIAMFSVVVISLLLVNRYRVINNAKRALEIERVRNNIARDLHDEMGSALSSINILSKVAMAEQEPTARQYLQNIGDQSEKMMEKMGDMVWSINPRNDSNEKVVARMREFATEILDAKSIDFEFSEDLPAGVNLDTDKRKNLFLIFKEAVNNAAKYSAATRMKIRLFIDSGVLWLTVSDNGKGFDEKTSQAGNGLRNMRERAAESGGTLQVTSHPGQGTEIQLRLSIA